MTKNTKLAYNEIYEILGTSQFTEFEYYEAQKKCEHIVSLNCLLKNKLVKIEVVETITEYTIQEILDIVNEASRYDEGFGCEYNLQLINGKIIDIDKDKKYRLI